MQGLFSFIPPCLAFNLSLFTKGSLNKHSHASIFATAFIFGRILHFILNLFFINRKSQLCQTTKK